MRLSVVGPDFHGFAVVMNGFSCPPLVIHGDAKIVIGFSVVGIYLNGFPVAFRRFF